MINKVFLMGRIGKKVYKPTKNGSNMCMLCIATDKKQLDSKGNQVKITTWHRVNFFGQKAEIVEKYTQIGDLIHIEGEISNRVMEKDGIYSVDHSIIGHYPTFIPNMKKDNFVKPEDNHGTDIPFTHEEVEEIPF